MLRFDLLATEGIDDTMVLAGDSHFWTTSEVQTDWDDPASAYVCTEFGGSSVTSANADEMGLPSTAVLQPVLDAANPQSLRYFDAESHGVGVVHLTATKATVRYMATETVREPVAGVAELAAFTVVAGTNRVTLGATDPDPSASTTTTSSLATNTASAATATPRFTG